MTTTHTYGYIRVSTEEQERDGISLDAQHARITQYVRAHDLGRVSIIQDVQSGRRDTRPGFQELIGHVRCGMARTIITIRVDRLCRSLMDLLRFGLLIERSGCALVCLHEQIETSTAHGRFSFQLLGALAEMESRIIGERTAAALRRKRERGEHTGWAPWGYRCDGPRLVPDPDEQRVLERIRRLHFQGYTDSQIEGILWEDGTRNRRGNQLHRRQISRIRTAVPSDPA